jgi:hypothetical protein
MPALKALWLAGFRDLDQHNSYQLLMLTAGIAHLTTLSLRPVLHLCSARNVDRVDVWLNLDVRLETLRAQVNWKSPYFLPCTAQCRR